MALQVQVDNFKFQDSNDDGWITLGDVSSGDKVFDAETGVEISYSQIQRDHPELLDPKIIAKTEGEAKAFLTKVAPEVSTGIIPGYVQTNPAATQSSGLRMSTKLGGGLIGGLAVAGALAYSWFPRTGEVDPELGLYSPNDFWIGDFPPNPGDNFVIDPNGPDNSDEKNVDPANPHQFVIYNSNAEDAEEVSESEKGDEKECASDREIDDFVEKYGLDEEFRDGLKRYVELFKQGSIGMSMVG